MYTPERESYEPTIVTATPVKGGIRQFESTLKENIRTPPNNKCFSYQKQSTPIRAWLNETATTTSLTPLIEKHSIRDVNPFYQASESDIAETPGMIVTPNSSFTTYDETPSRMFSIQSKLDDEMRRMEQLHEDLLEIKEQCSFLASKSSSTSKIPNTPLREIATSWRIRTPIDERRSGMDQQPYKIQKTMHTPSKATPLKPSTITTTTPARHSVYNEKTPLSSFKEQKTSTPFKKTPSSSIRATTTTPLVKTPYNNNSNNNNNTDNKPGAELKTPDNSTQEFLEQISSAKLRSTEIIRTPGGSRVANKFWREIHGHNNTRSNTSTPSSIQSSLSPYPKSSSTIIKQSATPNDTIPPPPPPPPAAAAVATPAPSQSTKRTWKDREEEFWSESSPQPTANAFTHRLFKAAHEERIMSLEDELNSAAKKEEANKPRMKTNTDMIAELKARHRDKFLDDSDSYKFA